MANKIYIVRHGQDTDNFAGILNGRRDTELTELGKKQTKLVAEKLKDNNIKIIYTSPLKRACETAKIIARELGINEIIIDEYLTERDFGILTGQPVSDIPKYTDKIFAGDRVNYFLTVDGAEDFFSLLTRANNFLQKIKAKHQQDNILIVTHGDIGKMLQASFYNWDWQKGLSTPYLDNTHIIELA